MITDFIDRLIKLTENIQKKKNTNKINEQCWGLADVTSFDKNTPGGDTTITIYLIVTESIYLHWYLNFLILRQN